MLATAVAQRKIVEAVDIDMCSSQFFISYFFLFSNAVLSHCNCNEVQKNVLSLEYLVKITVPKTVANRIAGSGFSYKYLKAAYFGNPTEGIFNLLSEQVRNSVRVTKSQKVISSTNYFASKVKS